MVKLTEALARLGGDWSGLATVADALATALAESAKLEKGSVRIIAFGSFVTAAAAIECLRHDAREGAKVA